jgi:pyruvate/2-oxoglutarate dehydrogenase complex dihydrolipoamide dehydrogenase (E3) component
MFSRLGSKVMIFQDADQLLPREDEDIARELLGIFWDEAIDIHLNSQVESFKLLDDGTVEIGYSEGLMKRSLNATHVLITTGTEAATKALNLKKAGIDFTERGYIVTNDLLETSVAGIYAMGDCRLGPEFTHTSYDDYRIISDHLFGAKKRKLSDRIVAFTLFTDPQLGRVGLNENQCVKKGIPYRKAILRADKIARAIETNQSRGIIKVLIGEDDKILGATVLLNQGGELASLIQTAMMGGLKYQTLRDSVFPHPTYAESVENLFANITSQSGG